MKLTKDQIILDILNTNEDMPAKILELKKQQAAREYKKKFKSVANNSNHLKMTATLLKITPAILLLTVAGLDIIVTSIPGNSIIYSLLAAIYFFCVVTTTDKTKKRKNFTELCEVNFLIEEINELEKAKPKNLNRYLVERNKKLEEILKNAEHCELMIDEPYNKLITVNDNTIILAEPVSYDTETGILEYNLYNEIEILKLPEESIICGSSPVINNHLYIDILNSKALLYQN